MRKRQFSQLWLAALWQQFCDGNADAWSQVAEIWRQRLLQIARRRLRNDSDAEDAVQETLVLVFEQRDRAPENPEQFEMRLYLLLRKVIYDRLKPWRRMPSLSDLSEHQSLLFESEQAMQAPEPEEIFEQQQREQAVQLALDNLHAADRELLLQRFGFHGPQQSYRELASECLVSAVTVQRRTARLLRLLGREVVRHCACDC